MRYVTTDTKTGAIVAESNRHPALQSLRPISKRRTSRPTAWDDVRSLLSRADPLVLVIVTSIVFIFIAY
ncbi:hypothetical protein QFZ60_001564 [Arthrobacter sp. B2I5]|nr:hypothetical protein [Arthrobacter sp. B2I5]